MKKHHAAILTLALSATSSAATALTTRPTCDGFCIDLQVANLKLMGNVNLPLGHASDPDNNDYRDIATTVTVSQYGAGLGGLYIPDGGTPQVEMNLPLRIEIEDNDPAAGFTNGAGVLDLQLDTAARFGSASFQLPTNLLPLTAVGGVVTYDLHGQVLDVVTGDVVTGYTPSKLKAPLGYDVNLNGEEDLIYLTRATLDGTVRLWRKDVYTVEMTFLYGATFGFQGGVEDIITDPLFDITLAVPDSAGVSAVPLPASFWLLAGVMVPLVGRLRRS